MCVCVGRIPLTTTLHPTTFVSFFFKLHLHISTFLHHHVSTISSSLHLFLHILSRSLPTYASPNVQVCVSSGRNRPSVHLLAATMKRQLIRKSAKHSWEQKSAMWDAPCVCGCQLFCPLVVIPITVHLLCLVRPEHSRTFVSCPRDERHGIRVTPCVKQRHHKPDQDDQPVL